MTPRPRALNSWPLTLWCIGRCGRSCSAWAAVAIVLGTLVASGCVTRQNTVDAEAAPSAAAPASRPDPVKPAGPFPPAMTSAPPGDPAAAGVPGSPSGTKGDADAMKERGTGGLERYTESRFGRSEGGPPPPPAPVNGGAGEQALVRGDGVATLYSFIAPPGRALSLTTQNHQAQFDDTDDASRDSNSRSITDFSTVILRSAAVGGVNENARLRANAQAAGIVAPTPLSLPEIAGLRPGANEELWIIERPGQTAMGPGGEDPTQLGAGEITPDVTSGEAPAPISATSVNVDARIDGFIAQVVYRQSFQIDPGLPLSGVYLINLPPDASVTDFQIAIGERRIRAVISDRAEAARLYAVAAAQGYRAMLTRQVAGNRFAARITLPATAAPSSASNITLEMTYFHVLPMENDEFVLRVPLRVNAQGSGVQAPVRLSLGVRINGAVPIEEIRSSSHVIRVDRAALGGDGNPALSRARATVYLAGALSEGESPAARDFVLHYRLAGDEPRPGMLTYTDGVGDTYFAAFIVPSRAGAIARVRHPIEWVLVIDRSSAVSAEQLTLISQIAREFLSRVDSRDRVRVEFSDGSSIPTAADALASGEELPLATAAQRLRIRQSLESLTAQGADTITPALRRALAIRGSPQLQRITLLISPGRFSDAQDALSEIDSTLKFNRVCAVSVGPASDSPLLRTIACYGRGSFLRIDRFDDIEAVLRPFVAAHASAPLIDVSLDFNDTKGHDVLPRRAPDVLADRPTMIVGRWIKQPASVLSVTGRAGPDVKFMLLNPGVTDLREGNPALAQVWARRKLSDMATFATNASLPTFETEARAISAQFGIPSPWTALLMVDGATPRPAPTPAP